jgi:hypothetical protein
MVMRGKDAVSVAYSVCEQARTPTEAGDIRCAYVPVSASAGQRPS